MTKPTTWYQRGQGRGFFRNLYWAWFLSAAYFLMAFAPVVRRQLKLHEPDGRSIPGLLADAADGSAL